MEVKDVKQKRSELESKIKNLIKDFYNESGVVVSKIHVYRVDQMDGNYYPQVEIDLDFPHFISTRAYNTTDECN